MSELLPFMSNLEKCKYLCEQVPGLKIDDYTEQFNYSERPVRVLCVYDDNCTWYLTDDLNLFTDDDEGAAVCPDLAWRILNWVYEQDDNNYLSTTFLKWWFSPRFHTPFLFEASLYEAQVMYLTKILELLAESRYEQNTT